MKFFDWFKTGKQFIKFAVVGIANTIIDIGFLNLLIWLGGHVFFANTVAFLLAATNGFFWNKFWTFQDHHHNWKIQLPFYLLIVTVGLLISNTFIYIFNLKLGWDVNIAKVLSIGAVFLWNFFATKSLVFKR